ncbi:MAG: polymer-forming cytoskeletal protein [Patescibacteria group bacterium]|jgi:cytoskeletal protein CcmA (bactofilin family)|nr:polymer-forming cytoskeletal protein [Patescibacteria group bacterium]
MKKIYISIISLLLIAPTFALAAEIQFKETSATIDKSQNPKNLYVASQTVNIDGNVSRDLTAAGNSVNVDGNVEGSTNVAGTSITIKGNTGNNVRAIGQNIVVQGNVGGDLLTAGQIIVQEKSSLVTGDILAVGNTIELDGKIMGNVRIGAASKVVIRGDIGGFVQIEAVKDLTVENSALIAGKLTYKSPNTANIANEQNIKGGVEYKKQANPDFNFNFKQVWYWSLFVKSIVLLIVLLIAVYLVPRFARNFVNETYKRIWPNLGWGAFTLFVLPIIGVILFITLIGIPFAVILGLIYLLMAISAGILTPLAIGSLVMKLVNKSTAYAADWKAVVVGAIIAFVLQLIPVIGPLVLFVFFLFALGEIALTVWGLFKKQRA